MEPDAESRERERLRGYFETGSASWNLWARGRRAMVAERRRILQRVVRDVLMVPARDLTVCDVGCGPGDDLEAWAELGVPDSGLSGTELIPARATAARESLPGADIREVSGFELPFPDGTFRLTTASMVLSAIVDEELRRRLVAEMMRVTAVRGAIAVYDFRVRKPTNRNVVALTKRRAGHAAGRNPDLTWPAAPFLPLLDLAQRLPLWVRHPLVRLLPRTHVMYVWRT